MLRWNSLFPTRLPKGRRRRRVALSGLSSSAASSRRLSVESLEDRRMLAVLMVNSAADDTISGDGLVTLREAIFAANTDDTTDLGDTGSGSDTIEFDASLAGATIDLSKVDDTTFGPTALLVTSTITIDGADAPFLTISRDGAVENLRLFRVTTAGDLTLRDITLTEGIARGEDGQSVAGGGAGGGGAGMGGAVFNEGTLTIVRSTLTGNQAIGGTGGNSKAGGRNDGGDGGDPHGGDGGTGQGGAGTDGGFGGGGGGSASSETGTPNDGANGGFGGGGGGGGGNLFGDGANSNGGQGGFGAGNGGGGGFDSPTVLGGGGGGGAGLGGAVFNHGGNLTIVNSTLANNAARGGVNGEGEQIGGSGLGLGGAVFSRNGSAASLNVTMNQNEAKNGGGGVFVLGDDAQASFNLSNTIIANSDAFDSVAATINDGTLNIFGNGNLVENNGSAAFTGTIVETGNPLLGALAPNGGATQTLLPDPLSPVRDAGDDGFLIFAQPIDQRGVMRVLGAQVDIGAVELNSQILFPDDMEDNDTLEDATILGSPPFVTVTDVSIHNFEFGGEILVPVEDVDFYKYTAHYTGKLVARSLFDHTIGNLDLQVLDMNGNVIATSTTSSAEMQQEEIIIPVVSQEMYFVRVYGPEGEANTYSLEVENFPAPIPERPELHPDDDNGASNTDNITTVEDPRVFIQADLADFADMGITILTSAQAEAAMTPGAAVEVFINGVSQGFADAVGSSNTLFLFQLDSDVLADGLPIDGGTLNFVTAAVRIFDGKQVFEPPPVPIALNGFIPTPATGRTMLSEPLELRTVEAAGPQVSNVTVGDFPDYDLLGTKPTTHPTPLVDSLIIEFAPTYDVNVGAPFTYEDISASGTDFSGDDQAMQIPIGFVFPFFDEQYSNVYVSTNGLLTFNSGVTNTTNEDLTQAGTAPSQPVIAPLWDDWDIDAGFAGRGYYETLGTAGVDLRLVVQWHDVEHFNANGVDGTVDFEAVLFEDGTIEFRYNDVTTGSAAEDNGNSATVGIRAAEPTAVNDGDVFQVSYNQAVISAGQAIRFQSPIDPVQAENVGNYQLVGDANGQIVIASADYLAPNKVQLHFASPLPDDHYTFTIFDSLTDLGGNPLDGEFGGVFNSGNGVPGGDFNLWFVVDSRAEIGTWAASTVLVDTNGNFIFDPANTNLNNRDLAYRIGYGSDYIFAGKFSVREVEDEVWLANGGNYYATGFDTIAAYGRVDGNQFRWLIDTDDNGVVDQIYYEPVGAGVPGIPVAGNFDGNFYNGDEVGLFDGTFWYFDTNHNFNVSDETPVQALDYTGFPIVGDFDGDIPDNGEEPLPMLLVDVDHDGDDDVATYLASHGGNIFYVDLNEADAGDPILIDGVADFSFRVGYPDNGGYGFAGTRERPVAADFNGDGIDDFGLYVVDGIVPVPNELAEWYLLLSGDDPYTAYKEVSVLDRILDGPLNGYVPFSPFPFANDLYAQFGNTFALPIAGNFDPPASPAATTASVQSPPGTPASTPPITTLSNTTTAEATSNSQPTSTPTVTEEPKTVETPTREPATVSDPVVEPAVVVTEPAPEPTPPKETPIEPVVEPQPTELAVESPVVAQVPAEEPAATPSVVVEQDLVEQPVAEPAPVVEAVVAAEEPAPSEPVVVEPAVAAVAERVESSPSEQPPVVESVVVVRSRSRVRSLRYTSSRTEATPVSQSAIAATVEPTEEEPPIVVTAAIDTVDAGEDLAVQQAATVDEALGEIAAVEIAPQIPQPVPEAALVQAAAWQSASQQQQQQDSVFSSRRFRRLILK